MFLAFGQEIGFRIFGFVEFVSYLRTWWQSDKLGCKCGTCNNPIGVSVWRQLPGKWSFLHSRRFETDVSQNTWHQLFFFVILYIIFFTKLFTCGVDLGAISFVVPYELKLRQLDGCGHVERQRRVPFEKQVAYRVRHCHELWTSWKVRVSGEFLHSL